MPISKVRDIRQPGHFWADNEVVEDYLPTIGAYGFAVYMLLAKCADAKTGHCDPSVGWLARKLGLSDPTVRKALDKLAECGLITVRHRRREKNGKLTNQTSIYTLLAVEKHQSGAPTKPDLVPYDIDQGTKGDLPGVLNVVDQGTKPRFEKQYPSNNTQPSSTDDGDGRKKKHRTPLSDWLTLEGMGAAEEFADLDEDVAKADFTRRRRAGDSCAQIVRAWRVKPPVRKAPDQNGVAPLTGNSPEETARKLREMTRK